MSLSMSPVKTLFQFSPATEPEVSSDTLDGSPYDLELEELDDSCPYIRVGEHRVGVAQVPLHTPQASPNNPQVDELEEYQPYIRVGKHQVGVVEFPNGTGTYRHSLAGIEGQYTLDCSEELDDEDDDDHAVTHVSETSPTTKENLKFLNAVEEEKMDFSALHNSPLQSSTTMGRHEYSAVTTLKLECSETTRMFHIGCRASRDLSEPRQLNHRPAASMNDGAKRENTFKKDRLEITPASSEGHIRFDTVVRRRDHRYRQIPSLEIRERGLSRRQPSLPKILSSSPSPSSGLAETDSTIYLKATRIAVDHIREHRRVEALSNLATGLFRRPGLIQTGSDEEEAIGNTAVRRPRGGFFHVIKTQDGRTNIGVPGTWIVEIPTLSSRYALANVEATESTAHHHARALAQLEGLQAGDRSVGPVPRYLQRWNDRTTRSGAEIESVAPLTYSGDALKPLASDTEVEEIQTVQENTCWDIHQREISLPALPSLEATRQAKETSCQRPKHHHFLRKTIRKLFRRFGKH